MSLHGHVALEAGLRLPRVEQHARLRALAAERDPRLCATRHLLVRGARLEHPGTRRASLVIRGRSARAERTRRPWLWRCSDRRAGLSRDRRRPCRCWSVSFRPHRRRARGQSRAHKTAASSPVGSLMVSRSHSVRSVYSSRGDCLPLFIRDAAASGQVLGLYLARHRSPWPAWSSWRRARRSSADRP